MHNTTSAAERQEATRDKRERYTEARRLTARMARLYWRNGDDARGWRLYNCGRVIMAGQCKDCGGMHSVSIDRACGMRLCAICAMRRSRVIAAQGLEAMGWIEQQAAGTYKPYLVTLTQRNVAHGKLGKELGKLADACSTLRNRREVRRDVLGMARTIEITHNHKAQSWHPHVHMIVLLRIGSELDTAAAWSLLWAEQMGVKRYKPIVDVRPLHDTDGAVYEVSKYITKFGALLTGISDADAAPMIAELRKAVYDRKLQVWTGIWREARRALQQEAVELMTDSELDELAAQCPDCGGAVVDGLMQWAGMAYEPLQGGQEAPES